MDYIKAQVPVIREVMGLDAEIQRIQLYLAEELPWLERSYGKATTATELDENNKTVFIPEVYAGAGSYLQLRPNNFVSSHSFFRVEGGTELQQWAPLQTVKFKSTVSLIVWVNLELVKSRMEYTYMHRYTEQLKNDLLQVLKNVPRLQPLTIFENPADVYRGYTINHAESQTFKHPEAGFRVLGTLTYAENCLSGLTPEILAENAALPFTVIL